MADDPLNPNQPPPAADPKPTPDGEGRTPKDQPKGADTPPANPLEASGDKPDKQPETKIDTNSPEFKEALTKAIRDKLPQLQKQARKDVAKELSGEKEGEPTVEELKSKISERDARLRVLEARDQLEIYVSDKRNQVQVRNLRGLFKLIKDDLKFDDEGNVTNFKDVIAAAKTEASEFFGGTTPSIDAGIRSANGTGVDMNTLIRGR